jgi:hypothetical protein
MGNKRTKIEKNYAFIFSSSFICEQGSFNKKRDFYKVFPCLKIVKTVSLPPQCRLDAAMFFKKMIAICVE